MKKIFITICVTALTLTLFSCQKQEIGIFNPSKKIISINKMDKGEDYVQTQFFWNDGQLAEIVNISGIEPHLIEQPSIKFTYDGNKIVKAEALNEYVDYKWDGDKLIGAKLYSFGLHIEEDEYIYEKNKPVLIKVGLPNTIDKLSESSLSPLNNILRSEEAKKILKKLISDSKGEKTIDIKLHWTDDNLTRIEFPDMSTCVYTYDNKKNPFSGLLLINFLKAETLSKNNVTSEHISTLIPGTDKYETTSKTYNYTYLKNYPESMVTSSYIGNIAVFDTIYYKY